MDVSFAPDAAQIAARLSTHAHDKLWDVLEAIVDDPDEAPHQPWARYVSSRRVWGSKIPGTSWTVYWRITGDELEVVWILEDAGL